MEFLVRSAGGYQIVALKGDLNLYTVPEASRLLDNFLKQDEMRLALDLEDLDFIDSSGIAAIVHWRKQIADGGGAFALLAVPENLRGLFELARLGGRIDFLDSEADLR